MFDDNTTYTSVMTSDPRLYTSENELLARQYDMVIYPKGDQGDVYQPELQNNGDINFINLRNDKPLYSEPINIKGPVTKLEKGEITTNDEGKFEVSITEVEVTAEQDPIDKININFPISGTSLNGQEEKTHNSFYAPIESPEGKDKIVVSNENNIPIWQDKDYYLKEEAQRKLQPTNTIAISENNEISVKLNQNEQELKIDDNKYLTTQRHIPRVAVGTSTEFESMGDPAAAGFSEGDLYIMLDPPDNKETT